MKKTSQKLIFIIGLFALNNSFGADGKYNNKEQLRTDLKAIEINESKMINEKRLKHRILYKLVQDLLLIINFEETTTASPIWLKFNSKSFSYLFSLSPNKELVDGLNYPQNMFTEMLIANYVNAITDIAIAVFAYNNIEQSQQDQKIFEILFKNNDDNKFWVEWKKGDKELNILNNQNKKQELSKTTLDKDVISFQILKSLNEPLYIQIIDQLKKFYVEIPKLKKVYGDAQNPERLQTDDIDLKDYEGNLNKSSKDVILSLANIIRKIFTILNLSDFAYNGKDKILSFKIGDDSFSFRNNSPFDIVEFSGEKKYFDGDKVEEMVEKIDFASPKKEDQDQSNKFKNNNPGSSNNSGSSNDSTNSDDPSNSQGGENQFGVGTVVVTAVVSGVACGGSIYFYKNGKNNTNSDKNQNPSMDEGYPNYEQSFDKLQTGPAAA
jgi:hypothetical protein